MTDNERHAEVLQHLYDTTITDPSLLAGAAALREVDGLRTDPPPDEVVERAEQIASNTWHKSAAYTDLGRLREAVRALADAGLLRDDGAKQEKATCEHEWVGDAAGLAVFCLRCGLTHDGGAKERR